MKKQKDKNHDLNMPIGKTIIIKDFLPPPHELVFPNDTQKVTTSLDMKSINFFKKQAVKNNTKYQKMIRALLSHYASHYYDSE
jgi:hypothetical protein